MTTNRAASSRLERSVHAEVEIVLHPIPTADSKPYIIVFGPDQQLWFCESGTSKIGRMNPGNGSFIEFDTPTPNSRLSAVVCSVFVGGAATGFVAGAGAGRFADFGGICGAGVGVTVAPAAVPT